MGPLTAPDPARGAPARRGAPPAIRAQGLGLRYPGGREALREVELEVTPGEVVALLGPIGSGKTSLLRVLATDLRPTGGTLELLGIPAVPPFPGLRRRIGYAPDHPVHLDALTGEENLRLLTRLSGADARDPALGLPSLLEALGLQGDVGVPVGQYSFGMRRKLLLAQLLAPRPPLLLLDEPTVGLDPGGVQALGALLRRRGEAGAAVVLATNEIREAPRWARRMIFLHRGRILGDGPPETLMKGIQGRTIIEVDLAGPPPPPSTLRALGEMDGVEHVRTRGEGEEGAVHRIEVESRVGGRPLPAILQRLVEAGGEVREVRVREPDLGDLFRALTGGELKGLR